MSADLTHSRLRILLATVDIHRRKRRVTIREIACACGWHSLGWVHHEIKALRSLGLVAFEDGKDGTLRPTCTVTFEPGVSLA